MKHLTDIVVPNWSAPANIGALTTLRLHGHSRAPYTGMNLATHVGDELELVLHNRHDLQQTLQAFPLQSATSLSEPFWLHQTHSTNIALIETNTQHKALLQQEYDGAITQVAGQVCAVLTADCMPVLITNNKGTQVAAVHAGWRGLLYGIVIEAINKFACPSHELHVWVGPAISQQHFEVGDEVYQLFCDKDKNYASAFIPSSSQNGKWFADLFMIAKKQLTSLGVHNVSGGDLCTYSDTDKFYSYRREGVTGRIASLIWIK